MAQFPCRIPLMRFVRNLSGLVNFFGSALVRQITRNGRTVTVIEYALSAALIAVVINVAVALPGSKDSSTFNRVASEL